MLQLRLASDPLTTSHFPTLRCGVLVKTQCLVFGRDLFCTGLPWVDPIKPTKNYTWRRSDIFENNWAINHTQFRSIWAVRWQNLEQIHRPNVLLNKRGKNLGGNRGNRGIRAQVFKPWQTGKQKEITFLTTRQVANANACFFLHCCIFRSSLFEIRPVFAIFLHVFGWFERFFGMWAFYIILNQTKFCTLLAFAALAAFFSQMNNRYFFGHFGIFFLPISLRNRRAHFTRKKQPSFIISIKFWKRTLI